MTPQMDRLFAAAARLLPVEMACFKDAMNDEGRCVARLLRHEADSAMLKAAARAIRDDEADLLDLFKENPGLLEAYIEVGHLTSPYMMLLDVAAREIRACAREVVDRAYAAQYEGIGPDSLSEAVNDALAASEKAAADVTERWSVSLHRDALKSALSDWEADPSSSALAALSAAAGRVIVDLGLSPARETASASRNLKEVIFFAMDDTSGFTARAPASVL